MIPRNLSAISLCFMKPFSLTSPFLLACALWSGASLSLDAQSNPYKGLWVGEVVLGKVNEVTVPLDAQNIPRAPDPNVPTPTFDAANLRLIVHVDSMGRASLLKQVAILSRKPETLKNESDMALVTDERLYGAFPPQAASRISSVVFDFGDAKATAAVDQLVERAATAAATAAGLSGATQASVKSAAQNGAGAVITESNAAERFNTFLQTSLDAAKVRAIANGGSTTAARAAATALRDGSFYADTRGIEMLDAIEAALAALPGNATSQQREQVALNTAAAIVETDQAYDRYLAGELMGDTIKAAADTASTTAQGIAPKAISSFVTANSGNAVEAISNTHGLATGEEIAIQGAAINAYNGIKKVVRLTDNSFRLDTPFVAGGAISNFAASAKIAPTRVTSPAHGLQSGTAITIRGSIPAYNGIHFVTVLDENTFTIPIAFDSDPLVRGLWSAKTYQITSFESTPNGVSGVKVTAQGHGLYNGQEIEIVGSGVPSYNGLKRITRIDDNSFTIPIPYAGNPEAKGSWDFPKAIVTFQPPEILPTLVTSAAHRLSDGDRVVISGSDKAEYNAEYAVTVVSPDTFSIPLPYDTATGNPTVKGSWAPGTGGQWRKTAPIRSALEQLAKVTEARTTALNVKLTSYSDTRAPDALQSVIDAIVATAALSESPLATEIANQAEQAGREALTTSVARYPRPTRVPSIDYNSFVTSSTFANAVTTAADAAATAALKEKADLLATPASIRDKAREAAINALNSVYSAAARSLLTEMPMTGSFASSLATEIVLPANHPTNPFRHRRHPDHTSGFDIRRLINLNFQPVDGQSLTRSSYGVDRISGVYSEEIFGLHKPLGPSRNIGLKVSGTFQLYRISLIDTLNGR